MWIDTHCHTKYSYDNWLEPLDLIRRAKSLGLDGVCITEHYSYEASEPVERIGREEGLLVLRGVEIATDRGHLLAYGVVDDGWNIWNRDSYLPLEEVIERINDLGGDILQLQQAFHQAGEPDVAERMGRRTDAASRSMSRSSRPRAMAAIPVSTQVRKWVSCTARSMCASAANRPATTNCSKNWRRQGRCRPD